MSIKKQAQLFTKQGLAHFTGYMVENPHEKKGEKPRKKFNYLPLAYENMKVGDWKSTHIMSNHNSIALTTGTKNKNLLLIDWDFKEWNKDTQTFDLNHSVLAAYHDMVEKLGGEINTYTETTGNGGKHWIYKYDPVKLGFVIKQTTGFIYNGIKCGDIRGENGLIYTAPSRYKDINGDVKEYEVENDMPIAMAPDMLFELIPFTKYEINEKRKASDKAKLLKIKVVGAVAAEVVAVPLVRAVATPTDSGVSSASEEVEEEEEAAIPEALPEVTQLNTEYDFVNAYLHCINDTDDYKTWLDVCLSVSTFPQYHALAHAWARQSSKYTYNETQSTIENGNGKKTLGSLYYMATKNKTKYTELINKVYETDKEFQTMITTFNDNDISKYFFKFHKYSYVYEEQNDTWFSINSKNIWEQTTKYPETLKTHIIYFVTRQLEKYNQMLVIKKKAAMVAMKAAQDALLVCLERMCGLTPAQIQAQNNLSLEVKGLGDKIKQIEKCIVNIGKSTFIRNVIDMLKVYCINKPVAELLITQSCNKHKFAFPNGYYDLHKKEFINNIEPTDYITTTTGYDYTDTPDPDALEKVNKTLADIADDTTPDSSKYISDLQYIKNILSSTLYGQNKRREFYIFTGSGANGKSMICDSLMKPAFGSYYQTMSANFYTKADHNAGCATPETADKQYCRPMVSSEPEEGDKLQVGKIKNITGLEELPTRQLYGKLFKYVPQFTPIMLCNNMLNFNKIDKAIVQRVKILNFNRKFVEEPKLPNDMLLNLDLKLELDTLKIWQAFIYILIENYTLMDNSKRSKASIEASDEFNNVNNPILDFITSKIVKTTKETPAKDVYNAYVSYCLVENVKPIGNTPFSKLMMYNDFEKRTDTHHKTYWKNCSLIDEVSEGEEETEETVIDM
jgi:P4 family phage/plasmid primase-like protien